MAKMSDVLEKFSSIEAACAAYKIPTSTFEGRIARGWSVEEALTIPSGGSRHTIGNIKIKTKVISEPLVDEKGNVYPSRSAACREFNIPGSTFDGRRQRGWSIYDALHTPRGTQQPPKPRNKAQVEADRARAEALENSRARTLSKICKECRDHKGNVYASINEMCGAYGIPTATYHMRIRRGWALKKALTTPLRQHPLSKTRNTAAEDKVAVKPSTDDKTFMEDKIRKAAAHQMVETGIRYKAPYSDLVSDLMKKFGFTMDEARDMIRNTDF